MYVEIHKESNVWYNISLFYFNKYKEIYKNTDNFINRK